MAAQYLDLYHSERFSAKSRPSWHCLKWLSFILCLFHLHPLLARTRPYTLEHLQEHTPLVDHSAIYQRYHNHASICWAITDRISLVPADLYNKPTSSYKQSVNHTYVPNRLVLISLSVVSADLQVFQNSNLNFGSLCFTISTHLGVGMISFL